MNIVMWIIIIVGGAIGLGSTLGIVGMAFWTLASKIYHKAKFGMSLYD